MKERGHSDESHVRGLIARVWDSASTANERELRDLARAAASEPRALERSVSRSRPRRAASIAAVGLVALLVGSGLGFGVGSSLTSSDTARASVVGFGFLPVRGWTVVQSGAIRADGTATAFAANLPIHSEDTGSITPARTLASLPRTGALIAVTFSPRGDPGEDFKFPAAELPLRVADAQPLPESSDSLQFGRHVGVYRLWAGVGGYNVDVRLFFGASTPSPAMLAGAQRQLNRLVVAADRVTISARPAVAGWAGTTLFGSVDSGRAGESVSVEAKDCGRDYFRLVGGASTEEGGSWTTTFFPTITTTLRAVWKEKASAEITVRQRALVSLQARNSAPGFTVLVKSRKSVWRKQVQIQRRDRRLGTWRGIKTVVLTDTGAAGVFSWASANFTISVPRGTEIRAFMPRSQASPCYAPGTSASLRT